MAATAGAPSSTDSSASASVILDISAEGGHTVGGDRQEDGGAPARDGVEVSPDAASTLWASCWNDRTPICSLPPSPPPLAAQPPPPGQNQAEGSQAVIEEHDEDVEEIDDGEEEFSSEERAFLAERRAAVPAHASP